MREGEDSRQLAIERAPDHDVGGLAGLRDEEGDRVEERGHVGVPAAHRH